MVTVNDYVRKVEQQTTVKLYEASTSPVFLVVIVATPNWVKASNVGTLTLIIFPGLLQKSIYVKKNKQEILL